MNKKIQKIGILIRPNSPDLKESCIQIFNMFFSYGIELFVEKHSSVMLGFGDGFLFEDILEKVDAIASIGGDGTLISAVRRSVKSGLPVFGINMGRLGFLTAVKPDELESFIPLLLNAQYKIDFHRLLEIKFQSQNKIFYALNECFISKRDTYGMIDINAYINHEHFNRYRADALIVATPTGSSAYNISAGGSVVYPQCRVILLTPVCAHSLTQRPMVISDDLILEFMIQDDGMITIDGQENVIFYKNDVLSISRGTDVCLLQHPNRSYFAVLKEKFNWGDMG